MNLRRPFPAELAMGVCYGSEAKLDLLTIDSALGGMGMSPWPMMNEWGYSDILSTVSSI